MRPKSAAERFGFGAARLIGRLSSYPVRPDPARRVTVLGLTVTALAVVVVVRSVSGRRRAGENRAARAGQ
jgi:hypothetical protein